MRHEVDRSRCDGQAHRDAVDGLTRIGLKRQVSTRGLGDAQGVVAVVEELAQQLAVGGAVEFGQQAHDVELQQGLPVNRTGAGDDVAGVKVQRHIPVQRAAAVGDVDGGLLGLCPHHELAARVEGVDVERQSDTAFAIFFGCINASGQRNVNGARQCTGDRGHIGQLQAQRGGDAHRGGIAVGQGQYVATGDLDAGVGVIEQAGWAVVHARQ